ncbi:hypothetical protein H0I25_03725 [Cellulophaga sp. HaHa_2_95]|uniref:hypothetical protein n=1 Tax=Cellulophaga sp. HaHa_2_95 TaxID=2745558 RepID=UPI001C4E66C3|nr:hypothetical protein [Cellulophaga sp. HaHa_2_95]QXP56913.1 hypothetical protein H0I25_03725 [Cellulophaga sp. HaHa_2_95]
MKYVIKKISSTFLLFLFFTVSQTVKASVLDKDIVAGAVEQVNYLLKNNKANGNKSDNWYVYFLGGTLDDLEFVLNKRNDADFSSDFLFRLNEDLKKVNNDSTAVYVAFTEYTGELVVPIFPSDISSLQAMENYLMTDILTDEFNIDANQKEYSLNSFQKYTTEFQNTYQSILQEIYSNSNFSESNFDNILIPFTNYSERKILQQDNAYLTKKYNLYSLYSAKTNTNFNLEDFKKTYRDDTIGIANQYGIYTIEQKIERVILALDIYFNDGGSVAKPCESLRYDPKLQDIIKELEQDDAWKQMIAEDPCILNTIYPNLELYSDSEQFEKDLALFVCAPLYAAMAVPAGTVLGEALFIELTKEIIRKYTAKKAKDVAQAMATNITLQTIMNYYFGDESITSIKDSSERWNLALKSINKSDLAKDALIAAYDLDLRSDLVLTCINDGLIIDYENLENIDFDSQKCINSVVTTIGMKFLFDISSTTVKSVIKRIKANPSILKRGLRELLKDAGKDGKVAFSKTWKEFEDVFEPKGPLIRIAKVEGKYGKDSDAAADSETSITNKTSFANKIKNVLIELEKQIDEGNSDITALGANIQLNINGLESIKSTILAETADGYKVIFLETGGKTINSIGDYIATTTNRIKFLDAIKNGSINKATMVGDNANAYFSKTTNVEIDINSIEIYNIDSNGSITGNKKFKVNGAGNLAWLDDLVGVLPSGAKAKITTWVDEGLDGAKLKTAFNSSSDKTVLYNKLNSSKGINHQKAIINDYTNIPGVTQGSFVSNAVDDVTSNIVKTGNSKQFTMYPGQAKTFMKNASLSERNSIEVIEDLGNGIQFIKIKPWAKVYRVFDGYKPWDDISMTGNTLPNGSFWTFEKPNLVSDVIEGTAVMPEWNGMTKIIEIEVPSTGLYGWYGKAAKQPASSTTSNFYLKGGEEQIIINFGQNQQNISSVATSITSSPWIK